MFFAAGDPFDAVCQNVDVDGLIETWRAGMALSFWLAWIVGPAVLAVLLWLSREPVLRWWRLREGRIDPRYPVVLLHGFAGFDELKVTGERRAVYFRGLDELLERWKVQAFRPRVPAFGSVERRAQALAEQLEKLAAQTGHARFNLIAHSMGGLDARYAISRLGSAERVASLVTVGTPHRGTPVANLAAGVTGVLGMRTVARQIGVELDVLQDMTEKKLGVFNAEVPDVPGVYYGSVVAQADPKQITPLLKPVLHLLRQPSDGLVPTASQNWGDVLVEAEADHWGEIGWSKHGNPAAMVSVVLRELRARGL